MGGKPVFERSRPQAVRAGQCAPATSPERSGILNVHGRSGRKADSDRSGSHVRVILSFRVRCTQPGEGPRPVIENQWIMRHRRPQRMRGKRLAE